MNLASNRLSASRIAASIFIGLCLLFALSGCVREDDLTPDQRAFALDRELMCPVCDGQTLDQSHAQIAEDMKLIVREKIAEGDSNQEIRDYFVARYGEIVLAAPEASGFNLIVWLMPAVIAGGGALAVVWVLKNMRRQAAAAGGSQDVTLADRQLEKYLEQVDRDTGVDGDSLANRGSSSESEPG